MEFLNEDDICFVTTKIISDGDKSRWTNENYAWVSEEGQRIVEENATGDNPDPELKNIYDEWYHKDETYAEMHGYMGRLVDV